MMRKTDFMEWLSEFFQNKSNQLEYSQRAQPKRMQKVTLNLATATTRPLELNVPFSSLIVSKIYSTATPTSDKAGTLKVMFDTDDDSNVQNAIALYPNDSLRLGVACRKAYFTWTAQSDTSVDLYVFPDIEVVAGTTKTQIVGNVSVTPVAELVCTSIQKTSLNAGGIATYTCPVGKKAYVSGFMLAFTGTSTVALNTSCFIGYVSSSTGQKQLRIERFAIAAGDVITADTTGADSRAHLQIEEYTL